MANRSTGGARIPRKHQPIREGLLLGISVATAIWIWIAVVDAVVGEPLRTFTVLGGVARFTVVHFILCLVYGVVVVAVVHAAEREASLIVGAALVFFLMEFAFVGVSAILSHAGLGQLAWIRILGGNLVGAALTMVILWRRHPLKQEFLDGMAEGEE